MISHSKKQTELITNIISHLVLMIFALGIIIPFFMIIVIALCKSNYLATRTPFVWFPKWSEMDFSAFGRVLNDTTYYVEVTGMSMVLTGFLNTMKIAIPTLVIGMFSSSISAYAFAKMRFPGKGVIFMILLGSMMLPGIIMMVPSYVLYSSIGLTNSYFPLMVPGMFGSAACVFFLRQFFMGLPTELVEAAKIDGMSHFGIYLRIILPLAMPAVLAQTVLGFLAIYNDYLGPLIYLSEERKYTLQLALNMFSTAANSDLPRVMAACIMAMLPTIILYLIAQKYFIQGIALSGLKD
ncbi:MAG: carbohydrate ABC transporter permease [Clostridiales bacterium]|nr:carbohydrate ABC transporter permease [Clostridiales bacterium]